MEDEKTNSYSKSLMFKLLTKLTYQFVYLSDVNGDKINVITSFRLTGVAIIRRNVFKVIYQLLVL